VETGPFFFRGRGIPGSTKQGHKVPSGGRRSGEALREFWVRFVDHGAYAAVLDDANTDMIASGAYGSLESRSHTVHPVGMIVLVLVLLHTLPFSVA